MKFPDLELSAETTELCPRVLGAAVMHDSLIDILRRGQMQIIKKIAIL